MLYSVSKLLFGFLFKVLLSFTAEGKENIPKKGGFILASNHVSYLDPIALGVGCPRKLSFIARQDLFFNPLLGRWLSGVDVIPLKRDSADISALKEAIRRVKNGKPVVLFPEGSRRHDGLSGEPRAGIGFLAAKLGVPVIPAFVSGTEKVLPRHAKFIKPHKVSVRFGQQINIERRMPYQDSARLIMEQIRHLSC